MSSFLSALDAQELRGKEYGSNALHFSWYVGMRREAWTNAAGQLYGRQAGCVFPESTVSAHYHKLFGQDDCLKAARRLPELFQLSFQLPAFEQVTDPDDDPDRFAALTEDEHDQVLNIPSIADLMTLPCLDNLYSVTIFSAHDPSRRCHPALAEFATFPLLAPKVGMVSLYNVDIASLGWVQTLRKAVEQFHADSTLSPIIRGIGFMSSFSFRHIDPLWSDLAFYLTIISITLRMLSLDLQYLQKEDRLSLRQLTQFFDTLDTKNGIVFSFPNLWRLAFAYPFSKQTRTVRYEAFFSLFCCKNLVLILPANLGTKGQRRLLQGLKSSTSAPILRHLELKFHFYHNPIAIQSITPLILYCDLIGQSSPLLNLKMLYITYDLAQINFLLWFKKNNTAKYQTVELDAAERARVKTHFVREFETLDGLNDRNVDLRVEVKNEGTLWLTITRDYAGDLDVREDSDAFEPQG